MSKLGVLVALTISEVNLSAIHSLIRVSLAMETESRHSARRTAKWEW